MLTPRVHPPVPGEPAFALDRAHHDHGPITGPDTFYERTAPVGNYTDWEQRCMDAVDLGAVNYAAKLAAALDTARYDHYTAADIAADAAADQAHQDAHEFDDPDLLRDDAYEFEDEPDDE